MRKKIICALGFCLMNTVYADNFDLYLSGGAAFSRLVNTSIVQMNPFVINNYTTNRSTETGLFAGLGGAYSFNDLVVPDVNLTVGIAGYYTDLGPVQGIEYPFINGGNFDTLNYQFKATSSIALLESRLIYNYNAWQPYVLGGLGSAWNRFSNYSETPTIPALGAASIPNGFGNHTNTTFSYELGIGLQRVIYSTQNMAFALSLDYRYLNLGEGELTAPSAQQGQLHVSNLYTQGALLSLHVYV